MRVLTARWRAPSSTPNGGTIPSGAGLQRPRRTDSVEDARAGRAAGALDRPAQFASEEAFSDAYEAASSAGEVQLPAQRRRRTKSCGWMWSPDVVWIILFTEVPSQGRVCQGRIWQAPTTTTSWWARPEAIGACSGGPGR